jgi:ribosomal-protein-alanine N-acetyltransferase
MPQPTLHTPRLALVPLQACHAERLAQLGDDPVIYANTANIPSPYTLAIAHEWIAGRAEEFAQGRNLTLAITLQGSGELVGVGTLILSPRHRRAMLGYWVGAPYRGNGYALEAMQRLIEFGFNDLQLHRIGGQCFKRNLASAKVLESLGLRYEGCLAGDFLKGEVFEDLLCFGLLNADWAAGR